MLYGLMTEEINYSYDGGLYGELIRNRVFKDDPANPVHWSAGTGSQRQYAPAGRQWNGRNRAGYYAVTQPGFTHEFETDGQRRDGKAARRRCQ